MNDSGDEDDTGTTTVTTTAKPKVKKAKTTAKPTTEEQSVTHFLRCEHGLFSSDITLGVEYDS